MSGRPGGQSSGRHAPHMKTNAARMLDALGISYELRGYEVDPDDLSAPTVARKIQMPVEQVFKTLLTRTTDGKPGPSGSVYHFAVLPGDAELNLKLLAHAAGVRKLELAPLKEVEPLTGYIRGGVTVFAARRPFPVFLDELAEIFDVISVSAGQRGLQMLLRPEDYLSASGATVAALTRDGSTPVTSGSGVSSNEPVGGA
jgi:Cys-tRNA(Pro)/Cys-tRNA(Cys) deacylase